MGVLPVSNSDSYYSGREDRIETGFYHVSGCCCALGALLMLILLPLSFSGVDYDSVGLKTQSSTSEVDRSRIYTQGKYMIGPDYTFKTFLITAQSFDFRGENSLSVWTRNDADVSSGVIVDIDVSLQFKLRPQSVDKLYDIVGLRFGPLAMSRAIDAIKNTAPLFGIEQYLLQRQTVETALAANVSVALDSVFADLVALQLRKIRFPSDVSERFLTAAVQRENNDKELYLQEATVIRSSTEVEVLAIENDALRVSEQAVADAQLIVEKAELEALQRVENARNEGLRSLYAALNITEAKHKASLDYLVTLTDKSKAGLLVPMIDYASANTVLHESPTTAASSPYTQVVIDNSGSSSQTGGGDYDEVDDGGDLAGDAGGDVSGGE